MQLVDNYLKAIRRLLPAGQQDDIVNELSANIFAQIEDREAGLGRPLTESEQEALLRQHGSPMTVAGRYQTDNRRLAFGKELIGPVLFPIYEKVLSINISITALVLTIVALALAFTSKPLGAWETFRIFLTPLFIQFVIVTAIFIAAERTSARCLDIWTKSPDPGSKATEPERISRLVSFAEFVGLAIFIGWLEAVRHFAFLVLGPVSQYFNMGSAWYQMYPPMIALSLVRMVQAGINLVRPDWVGFKSVVRLVTNILWLVLICSMLQPLNWVIMANPAVNPTPQLLRLLDILNLSFFLSWIAIGLTTAWDVVSDVREFNRRRRRPGQAETHNPQSN